MSLATPRTQELADSILAQIEVGLEQDLPFLPKAFTHVLAKVLAAVHVILYKYCGWLGFQMFPQYASSEETVVNGRRIRPLLELGRQIGIGDPNVATRAQLSVRVTVTNQTGTLAAGAQLLFAPAGVLYVVDSARALDAATVDVLVTAYADQAGGAGEGVIGNRIAGDVLQFANPLPNVARNAVVLEQTITGADGETWEAYRGRVLRRWQRKPQGGAYADYQAWAEAVEGIANIYPYTGAPGEVDVYVEATEESSGSADGIPTGAQLTAVEEAIELDVDGLASNRPATAFVNVYAISRNTYDITISGLQADDVPSAQTSIVAAVEEYFASREPFIVGLSVLPRLDRITIAEIGGIVTETVNAVGGTVVTVTMSVGGIPFTADTLGPGEKAKLGVPTFL